MYSNDSPIVLNILRVLLLQQNRATRVKKPREKVAANQPDPRVAHMKNGVNTTPPFEGASPHALLEHVNEQTDARTKLVRHEHTWRQRWEREQEKQGDGKGCIEGWEW